LQEYESMNILVASIQLPWPLDSGGKVALYSSLACLRNDHRFTLVSPVWDAKGLNDAAEFQALFPEIRVHGAYCGPTKATTQPKDDILLRSFRWGARQYRRWRYAHNPVPVQEKEEAQIPGYPFAPLPEAFVNAVASELGRGINLVQAEFAEMLSLGAWLPPEIPKIFIHHQLHFVYAQRFSKARKLGGYSEYLQKVMCAQEEMYLRNFDGIVVFSDDDKRALSAWLEDERLYVSPFPISSRSTSCDDSFEGRFSFVGSEEHFPNRDGLEWLAGEIWPQIVKQKPSAILNIIGSWSEASRRRYSTTGIEFTGYVADLGNAIRGSVMLAPLRIGSGIRVKLLDAMSQGVPAISTSIGCEGIPARDDLDILIRDDAAEFAAAAVGLLNDSKLRARLASAGKQLVAEHYSPEQVRKRRNEIYEEVCGQASCRKVPKHGVAIP
jgi:polysaccharide biosynthesis protein PslH